MPRNSRRSAARTPFSKTAAFPLKGYLETRRREIDAALQRALPPAGHFPARLHRAQRHSLFSGGKRLRPVLVLAGAEACGGARGAVMPAACALECLHTYSLIHDDLPAMDNDDWRRGRPTCHKAFGEAAAILAGDALLTFAFELMTSVAAPGARVSRAANLLAKAAGSNGMVGGQMADLEAEGTAPDLPRLQYIHVHKTGKLIQAAVMIGGILAGGSPAQVRALSAYGERIGLAFQIMDDVLDITGSAKSLGKTPGKDRAAGKATYPALFGLEASKQMAEELVAGAQAALRSFEKSAEPLRALAGFITERKG